MSTSSLICKNFAQNAWKKDLCSNCFKSEVEHWSTIHSNLNEDVKVKCVQNLSNNSSIKMNINNMQMNNKNDCNSTASILKKSNPSVQVINSPKKHLNHVSSHFVIINGNKDIIKNNCNDVTLQKKRHSEENIENIVIKDIQKFPQKNSKVSTNNRNINNCINNQKLHQLRDRTKNMPLIGILKSTITRDLIKYRPKNKCLVFKEGDPLIIGYGIEKHDYEDDNGYDGSDNSDNDAEVDDDEDDDDDYEECFSSDDKELRELTRENTKFNSNFANLSVHNREDKNEPIIQLMDEKLNECKIISESLNSNANHFESNDNQLIPKACEKLVEMGINESFDEINANNDENQMQSNDSYSPVCDVTPMSTSSDSSSDEKEDSQQNDIKDENFNEVLDLQKLESIENNSQKYVEDSEFDDSNAYKESLEEREKSVLEVKFETKPNRPKPTLPAKPNLFPKPIEKLNLNNDNNKEETDEKLTKVANNSPVLSDESAVIFDEFLPQIVSDHIYQEIFVNNNSVGDKIMTENNNYILGEKNSCVTATEKREMKLQELAQELELVRHMKRPAPQPPKKYEDMDYDEVNKISLTSLASSLSSISKSSINEKHSNTSSKTKFSIKKLLNKKSSQTTSDKTKEYSLESMTTTHSESSSYSITTTSNPKAWKQSDFDRTNLKIVHPIDLIVDKINENNEMIIKENEGKVELQIRAEPIAPPRTPKPVRPSVPVRKKSRVLTSPTREPPPPPERSQSVPLVEMTIKSSLTEAYNQLAKSNHNNLMAIKAKIESQYNTQYQWSDFEVGNGLKYGSAMIYRDSIISNTGKSVNLLVFDECYCSPIVHQLKHYEEVVLMLDQSWTRYHLLHDLSENTFDRKQTNSLILQLYSILENCEKNDCNRLPLNTINSMIICSSVNDILLLIPLKMTCDETNTSYITLHQFLSQVLEKLLPNSLFESVAHVLCQQTIPLSHSKTIVQLIAFQTPVEQMDCEVQINYWFDISRCKFINQFCLNESQLTQLDYIYLQFLCNNNAKLIRNAIALMISCK